MPEDIAVEAAGLSGFYKRYFSYYNTLDAHYQSVFTERCMQFIAEKNISGAEGFVPDNRVKALVAASAVQLTLGLETWGLAIFENIVLHPSDFNNEQTALKFSGETNLNGFIRLSWKKFLKGYAVSDDNLNLGLHEFSHALRFNGVRGGSQDYFTQHYFYSWLASAYPVFEDVKRSNETIFRRYGGTNINEFISVCIEHYFESPLEIKAHYPFLYFSTAILLNQFTNGQTTQVGVRGEAFKLKAGLMPGFSGHMLRQSYISTGLAISCSVFLVTLLLSGFSMASLVAFIWLLVMALRRDSRYMQITLSEKEIILQKGLLVFKAGKTIVFPASQLISARLLEEARHGCKWELIFYNSYDSFFYSEELHSHSPKDVFVKELFANKVAYFK